MENTSLPKHLPDQYPDFSDRIDRGGQGLSPRARLLVNVAFYAALAAMLSGVWWGLWMIRRPPSPAPPQQSPPPIDFKLVEHRFGDVRPGMGREQVEALLGSPSQYGTENPELIALKDQVENSGRGIFQELFWHLWIDPKDENRWVAVLYTSTGRVYKKWARGVTLRWVP